MDISAALQVISTDAASSDERDNIKRDLSAYLNHLVENDFPALVQALYRVDVSEQRLKAVLRENPSANAGDLLAELMVQREKEKAIARQAFTSTDAPPPEEEAW